MKIDVKRGKEAVSTAAQKAGVIGKKVTQSVQDGAKEVTERAKNEIYLNKLKKYNPLFPHEYESDTFNMPNMIKIVDDAERRGIDVCEGAIGWLSTENGIEVLNLYDENARTAGIQFIPAIVCDEIYYVDNFDRRRFVRLDYIFSKAHEERLAELQHIAYSLGAKHCSIEIKEAYIKTETNEKKSGIKASVNLKKIKTAAETDEDRALSFKEEKSREGKITAEFIGNNEARPPQLKWFANDDTIKRLVEMRCDNSNSIRSQKMVLRGSTSATMSQKVASTIDGAVNKMNSKKISSMEKQALKENTSEIIFEVEF